MSKSQLEAHTFGMGQLITQRKVFTVPKHQRNFAWTVEQAEQYLQDIGDALTRNASDYFVGLIVLQGPIDNTWHILDGQQRLATTVMIYSAIRHWLFNHGLEQDARQIENEYIGVRQLGGKYSPRLQLNTDNFATFDKFIVPLETTETLKKELSNSPKRSSNSHLLEVALFCREWIATYATKHNTSSYQGNALFDLAVYLETKVSVVCVDVPDQVDAYVLFETLNDRGADLSALDLVRNYIFSQIGEDDEGDWRVAWHKMIQNIEGRNADDFLKVLDIEIRRHTKTGFVQTLA